MPLLKSAMLDAFMDLLTTLHSQISVVQVLGLCQSTMVGGGAIYHLSAPLGNSINDYINPDDYTLSYCSVDDAYGILNLLGTGALMSKIDLKNAFRLIQVHPNDWNLLGICWCNKFYIDTCLPLILACTLRHLFLINSQ